MEQESPRSHLTIVQVLMLNSVVCGLEFCASAAFTYIPPLLLKAGLTEEQMSFVLGIGPFLGFLVVPWIGHSSDNCRSRFGRRRPYILALSLLLLFSLVIIPYGEFLGLYLFGESDKSKRMGVILLIIGAVLLDFTSQACLTPCEALLSDACHGTNQQGSGFMVYSFMVSVGGCIGYLITALDWNSSAVGLYFGSQERSAFSVLIILFSLTLFFTLVVAQEKPLGRGRVITAKHRTMPNGRVEGVGEGADLLQRELVANLIPPQDPGYESGDNYNYGDDSGSASPPSPSITHNASPLHTPNPSSAATRLLIDSDSSPSRSANNTYSSHGFFPSRWSQRTLAIPFTRFSVSLARFDSFCYLLSARCYGYLPNNVRTLCEMPAVLKRLAGAHFCSWTAVMAFNLFFTDFVGQSVYRGNPNAPEDSPARELFDQGVRMGSWGLLIHCITSAIYAMFVERLTERLGARVTYVLGMGTFTAAMCAMVFTTNVVLVSICAACTGIGFATLTTIPYLLITKYHENPEIYFYDVRPEGTLPRRGMGADMASLDSAYFLSQVVLSAVMSSVVYVTGTVLAYVVVAAAMGALSCAVVHRVIFDKKDLAAMLKR